jgi:polyisoprenoid-binding protein YceI
MRVHTNPRRVFAIALTAVVLSACNNDPAKDKARANVAPPVASAAEPAAPAAAVTYAFSNDGSKVEFVGAKVTGKHEGTFGAFRGTIQLVGNDPQKSSVQTEIDTASLNVEPAKLAGHLKSADFFEVEKFPKASFQSTSIKPGGEKGATHTVTGNLELHGVKKSISFPATIRVSGDTVETDAEFAINRKDFGIVYPGKPDDLIKDDVLIRLQLRAKKAS